MSTNGFGFECEEMIRNLLPEIGIPHKHQANGRAERYWWASDFEDRTLGIDCWLTLIEFGEVAVDFTVISESNTALLQQKNARALNRGVVPIMLEQGMIRRAIDGSQKALEELNQEIRFQISIKIKKLNNRMTRERAADTKAVCRPHVYA